MPIPKPMQVLPTEIREERGELTDNESSFILTTTLKPKHRKDSTVLSFIDSFIRCKSISQASEECRIHASLGYKIRHRKDVANAIQKLIDKSAMKYSCDNSEIFERVKEIVDFDPIQVMNRDGSYKSNMFDIAPEARRNIKKLKVKNIYDSQEDINGIKSTIIVGEVIEYEFYNKLKASELVGKEKEMFKNTTKVEHSVTADMAEILLASAKRADERKVIDVTHETITYEGET